jgi:hypothetical protein
MAIEWLNSKKRNGVATISEGAITFNTTALEPLKSFLYVMIGYDREKKIIAIKPIDYNLSQRGDIDQSMMYKLSVSTSYGRITSKDVVDNIKEVFNKDIIDKKFMTSWDDDSSTLSILLNKEEK